jgi:hypothetical protein
LDFSSPPFEISLVLASALLAAVIGLLATLRRGHWLTTLLFSASFLSIAAFQAGILGILNADSPGAAGNWAIYLARTSALVSWLWLSLSVVLGRSDPWDQIRTAAAYLSIALFGCIAMSVAAGSPYVIRGVTGTAGDAVILFGPMGKVYLMYLVAVMVAVLMNLERMLRAAHATAQRRLRPMFVAFLVGIMSDMLVVSAGLLYGGLKVSLLVASAAPLFVSGVVTALALARRRLSDVSVPVARPVIYYSSVSLTLAGVFLLSMAVLSRLLPVLTPTWKQVITLGFLPPGGGRRLAPDLQPARQPGGQTLHRPELLRQSLRLPARMGAREQRDRPHRQAGGRLHPDREPALLRVRRRSCRHLPARRSGGSVAAPARSAVPARRDPDRQPALARAHAHPLAVAVP